MKQFYCENLNFIPWDVRKVFSKAGWTIESENDIAIVFIKKTQGYLNRVILDFDRRDTLDIIELEESEKEKLKNLFQIEGYIIGLLG